MIDVLLLLLLLLLPSTTIITFCALCAAAIIIQALVVEVATDEFTMERFLAAIKYIVVFCQFCYSSEEASAGCCSGLMIPVFFKNLSMEGVRASAMAMRTGTASRAKVRKPVDSAATLALPSVVEKSGHSPVVAWYATTASGTETIQKNSSKAP